MRFARAAALRGYGRASGTQRGAVLVYHGLAERTGNPAEVLPAHGADLLDAHLSHLRRHYAVVDAAEISEAAAARRRGAPLPVAITFDDDLVSHVDVAAPVLERHDVQATFFLTGAGLDRSAGFWWLRLQRLLDRGLSVSELAGIAGLAPDTPVDTLAQLKLAIELLPPSKRDAADAELAREAGPDGALLGSPGVRRLVEAGHTIGFHTSRHYRLTTLDDDALAAAMGEGRQQLAEVAGQDLTLIAYPHGRADERIAGAARAAGFAFGFTTEWRAIGPRSDRHLLSRIEPPFASIGTFALQLAQHLVRREL